MRANLPACRQSNAWGPCLRRRPNAVRATQQLQAPGSSREAERLTPAGAMSTRRPQARRTHATDTSEQTALQIYLPMAEMSVNLFLLLGMGLAVGLLSGMFGIGGGFILTPLLIFLACRPRTRRAAGRCPSSDKRLSSRPTAATGKTSTQDSTSDWRKERLRSPGSSLGKAVVGGALPNIARGPQDRSSPLRVCERQPPSRSLPIVAVRSAPTRSLNDRPEDLPYARRRRHR